MIVSLLTRERGAATQVVEATRQWADDMIARGEWVPGEVLKALAALGGERAE